jgi:ribosomal protein L37AE/L43A
MGYIIKPECNCGYPFKEFYFGGGMNNFETSCEVPFYCEGCGTIKVKNLFKKIIKCNKCEFEENLLGDDFIPKECEECNKLLTENPFSDKFICGKCRKDLVMYGVDSGYFSDDNLDFEKMRELEENSYEWSYILDRTFFLPYKNNYCPKCKTNNLEFHSCGIWD